MRVIINTMLGIREGLNTWWHRFLKVVFFFSLGVVFLISFVISFNFIALSGINTTIVSNLNDFTASSDNETTNTIPSFLRIDGELGCFNPDTNHINQIGNYYAEKYSLMESYCSYDLVSKIDDAVSFHNILHPGANWTKERILELLNKDTEKRYCLINKDVGCSSKNIVKYIKTPVFYIEALFYPLLAVFIWGIFWSVVYHRIFLYIVYGNKKIKK